MSESQVYEFLAIDRPLTAKEIAELRAISSRAEITPTRFWNEYQWGDLKARPRQLLLRYFDAHLYYTNWGTHRLVFRLPVDRVDADELERYFVSDTAAAISRVREYVVLDLCREDEERDFDEETPGTLAVLGALRAELLAGDLRPAYLAWLLALDVDELEDDAIEPPVPPGLNEPTAAQEAMIDFLKIDRDLIAAAASASAEPVDESAPLRRWLGALPAAAKEAWLRRALEAPDLALGREMMRAFRADHPLTRAATGRTVRELRALAAAQHDERRAAEAQRAAAREKAAAAAQKRRLNTLAREVDGAWAKLEKLVGESAYDTAVALAEDLRALAEREDALAAFTERFGAMRKRQIRRKGFFDRWKRVEEERTKPRWREAMKGRGRSRAE